MNIEKLNFKSPEPLYVQVSQVIEKKIREKEFNVGERLPTYEDLRKKFGVSIDTMKEAMVNLVELGYISCRPSYGTFIISSEPNRGIDLKKKNEICLVICTGSIRKTTEDVTFKLLIDGIESKSKEKRLNLLYKRINENDDRLFFEEKEKNVAGLIVAGNITRKFLRLVKKTKISFILIGDVIRSKWTEKKVDVITANDFQRYYLATTHLINLGHKRIVYLTCYLNKYPWDIEGVKGYQEALKEAGIDCDKALQLEAGDFSMESVYRVMKEFLKKSIPFTGLICVGSREPYFGVMKVFSERNIRIPRDVSIVNCVDLPGVTVVTHDTKKLGAVAVERLIERLNKPDLEAERIVLQDELIIRESTRKLNG